MYGTGIEKYSGEVNKNIFIFSCYENCITFQNMCQSNKFEDLLNFFNFFALWSDEFVYFECILKF